MADVSKDELSNGVASVALERPKFRYSDLVYPTLLDLSRELRGKIYGFLLTVDQSTEHKVHPARWEKNFEGIVLLGVNRQIRAEAWETIINTNAWIQVHIHNQPNEPVKPGLCNTSNPEPMRAQPYFMYGNYPPERASQLKSSARLTIHLGKDLRNKSLLKKPRKTTHLLFAYQPKQWAFFVNMLAAKVHEWEGIRIKTNSGTDCTLKSSGPGAKEILEPLSLIRGVKRASVCTTEEGSELLASIMTTPIRSDFEIMSILLRLQKSGDNCLKAGNCLNAMKYYWQGTDAYSEFLLRRSKELGAPYGSPQSNSMMAVEIELHSSFLLATNRLVKKRKEATGRVFGQIEFYLLDNAIISGGSSLKFEGITDTQRRLIHFRRGIASMNKATWLDERMRTDISDANVKRQYGILRKACYEDAAKDFFYAKQIDGLSGSDRLTELYDEMCVEIKRDPRKGFELASVHIPVVGDWSGDPRVLRRWGAQAVCMKMCRQRITSKMGETMDHQELVSRYMQEGIIWHYTEDGTIHLAGPGTFGWL
ncbi:putative Transcription factor domain-containing protein [Seiridium cardinale]